MLAVTRGTWTWLPGCHTRGSWCWSPLGHQVLWSSQWIVCLLQSSSTGMVADRGLRWHRRTQCSLLNIVKPLSRWSFMKYWSSAEDAQQFLDMVQICLHYIRLYPASFCLNCLNFGRQNSTEQAFETGCPMPPWCASICSWASIWCAALPHQGLQWTGQWRAWQLRCRLPWIEARWLVLESFSLWISNSQDNTLACWIKDSRMAICLGTLDMELLKIGVPKITILVLKPMVLGYHHFRKPSHN